MIMWEDTDPKNIKIVCVYDTDKAIYTVIARKGVIEKRESFEQNFQPVNSMDEVDFITSVSLAEKLAELF